MKIKKIILFITSDDNSFGRRISFSMSNVYSLSIVFLFFIIFFFIGIFSVFNRKTVAKIDTISESNFDVNKKYIFNDSILFLKDPVNAMNNTHINTCFITNSFSNSHAGLDINGDLGTKIYSPMDGLVLFAGYDDKVGNFIIISHGKGYETKYFHNKKNLVSTGDRITTKNPIAEMGNTGTLVEKQATHLHFELLKDGVPINPEPFIQNIKSVVTVSN